MQLLLQFAGKSLDSTRGEKAWSFAKENKTHAVKLYLMQSIKAVTAE